MPKQTGPAQPRRNAGEPDVSQDDARGRKPDKETPAAGPHAKDHLTNEDATPGAGTLNDEQGGGSSEPGTG